MVADPMFLAANPEMVPAAYLTGAGVWAKAAMGSVNKRTNTAIKRARKKRQRAIIIMKFLSKYRLRCK
jgi:hypothetical protein